MATNIYYEEKTKIAAEKAEARKKEIEEYARKKARQGSFLHRAVNSYVAYRTKPKSRKRSR